MAEDMRKLVDWTEQQQRCRRTEEEKKWGKCEFIVSAVETHETFGCEWISAFIFRSGLAGYRWSWRGTSRVWGSLASAAAALLGEHENKTQRKHELREMKGKSAPLKKHNVVTIIDRFSDDVKVSLSPTQDRDQRGWREFVLHCQHVNSLWDGSATCPYVRFSDTSNKTKSWANIRTYTTMIGGKKKSLKRKKEKKYIRKKAARDTTNTVK